MTARIDTGHAKMVILANTLPDSDARSAGMELAKEVDRLREMITDIREVSREAEQGYHSGLDVADMLREIITGG